MATAHSLSVITNSCVKAPVNPKTGLPITTDKRGSKGLSGTWTGKDADYDDPQEEWSQRQVLSRSVNFDTTNIETLASDLSGLSDEEFYNKLRDLRSEHKKTLELCENMYQEKLAAQRMEQSPYAVTNANGYAGMDRSYSQPVHDYGQNESFNRSVELLRKSYAGVTTSGAVGVDNVRDMSMSRSAEKPPSGRPRTSAGAPKKSMSRKHGRNSRSRDRDYWQVLDATSSNPETSDDEVLVSRTRYSYAAGKPVTQDDSLMSSVSRIEDMWENFSVDEYAPRSLRPRSNSMSRLSSPSARKKHKPAAVDRSAEWHHRVTIPQPFQMTIREAQKEKKKTRAMEELDVEKEEREMREEAECQKKFKATPVPAHIYMPLYDEIAEQQETRRRQNVAASMEKLKETQKPFKFTKREDEIRKQRRSESNPHSILQLDKQEKKQFKAKPFPEHIFENTTNDKIREEDEYRKIRMQMRAEELLQSSSLPPNMSARGKDYTDGKSRQKMYAERARKAGITVEHKFQPRVNDDVPDFEDLHRKFLQEMGNSKYQKEATVCKPFSLRTSQVASARRKIYEDIQRDEEMMKENRWPFASSRSRPLSRSAGLTGSWSSSLDSMPARMTTSADLRATANKTKIQQQIEKDLAEMERERKWRLKEKQLKKSIAEKAAANDQSVSLKSSQKDKLKEFRESERARREEYRRQLNEMQERVGQRPLLFERTSQVNAKNKAERRYRETLRRAGVDEDYVLRKSSGGGEIFDDEDDVGGYSRHSDPESDHDTYSRHSYHSQPRSHSSAREYSDDFDQASNEGSYHEEDDDY